MSDLLTTLTVTAVSPFLFNTGFDTVNRPLFQEQKPAIVIQKEKEAPKEVKEVKKEEAPAPQPPQDITYTVVEGDNLTVIAEKHQTSWVRIWQKNEQLQHQDQLNVGDVLTIPANDENLAERALGASVSASSPKVGSTTTSTPNVAYRSSGGANTYAYGWCTWWVKEKRPDIGGYWGNAGYSWISQAQAAGFSTGSVPVAGAIGVTAGHVVYVESVNGSTVNISEMGWGYRANTTANYRSVPASSFTYIY